jgi:molybdopterin converting factor small subunit
VTRVRLFAALRDAAGAAEVDVAAGTVAAMLDELGARYGEVMARRLRVAIVVVDGDTLPRDDTVRDLAAADEVVVMPPFAGG